MFQSLKNALGLGGSAETQDHKSSRTAPSSKVSEWAGMQGLQFTQRSDGKAGYQFEGKVGDKQWRLEQGKPSRDFIKGVELRARAELGVDEGVAVMVLSRQLKNDLDKRAFALYTDSLQTIADPHLPEEMRWLSIYEEVGWESLSKPFLNNYAILADQREHAVAWINDEMVNSLMNWPDFDPASPKIMMLLRGKAYLRMQHKDGDIPTLEHATNLFTLSCELALGSFKV
jgi:hypothetical protein